jgi:hypothetical protein
MGCQVTQISADSNMVFTLHTGHHFFDGLLVQIDGHHTSTCSGESFGYLAANAARCASDNNSFPFQSRANTPCHL